MSKVRVHLEFRIEDYWIGVFWPSCRKRVDVWLCLLPTLPLHITAEKEAKA